MSEHHAQVTTAASGLAQSSLLDGNVPRRVARRSGEGSGQGGRWLRTGLLGAGMLGLLAYLYVAAPVFYTGANLRNVALQASILAILAAGVTVVIISGNFDLSVASVLALSMVWSAIVMRDTESVGLGIVAGLLVGASVGAINGALSAWMRVPSFIVTLGMLVGARGLARMISDGRSVVGIPIEYSDFFLAVFLGLPVPVWFAVGAASAAQLLLKKTNLGFQWYATGGNARAAELAGIPVARVQTLAFVFSGLLAALAGLVLLGRLGTGQPNAANMQELFAVAAVVLGGTSLYGGSGSVLRTIGGVLLLAVLANAMNLIGIGPDGQTVVMGVVFVVAALVPSLRGTRADKS